MVLPRSSRPSPDVVIGVWEARFAWNNWENQARLGKLGYLMHRPHARRKPHAMLHAGCRPAPNVSHVHSWARCTQRATAEVWRSGTNLFARAGSADFAEVI